MIADADHPPRDSRMFANPLLERLTHSNFWLNVVVWVGIGLALIASAYQTVLAHPLTAVAVAAVSFLIWTFAEYWIHRSLFHY